MSMQIFTKLKFEILILTRKYLRIRMLKMKRLENCAKRRNKSNIICSFNEDDAL